MSVNLLTEHNLEYLSLKGGCTGWYESTFVKMQHFWKSHVTAHLVYNFQEWAMEINMKMIVSMYTSTTTLPATKALEMIKRYSAVPL